jgi:hypothetical protein
LITTPQPEETLFFPWDPYRWDKTRYSNKQAMNGVKAVQDLLDSFFKNNMRGFF